MGVLDEIEAEARESKGPTCRVKLAFDRLDPDTVAEFEETMFGRPDLGAKGIAKVLSAKSGIQVSDFTVARHRRKDCRCGR